MSTGEIRRIPCLVAPFAAIQPENVLLSGCGMTAATLVCRASPNNRGPAKGPLSTVSRIFRGAVLGRIQSVQPKGVSK